jgi:hypothetical protein
MNLNIYMYKYEKHECLGLHFDQRTISKYVIQLFSLSIFYFQQYLYF